MSTEDKATKRPTHGVYVVQGEGEDKYWFKIGSGWPNKDNKGLSFILNAAPLSNRIVVRELSEKDQADTASGNGGQQ